MALAILSGIIGTLLVQILVLLALGYAVVPYLEWSSDTNLAEFINAIRPPASDPNHSVGSLPHVTSALVSRPDGRTP